MVQLVVRWLWLDDSIWLVQIAMMQIGSVVVQFCFSWLWIDVTCSDLFHCSLLIVVHI